MTAAIRVAKSADLHSILAIEGSAPELPHWPLSEYQRYVAVPGSRDRLLCVAETDGVLLGFAAAALNASDARVVDLESIAVLPAMRRGGVGRQLGLHVIEWSRLQERQVLELEVRSRSSGAIALYHSLGFRRVRVRSRYYANPVDDALLMSLVL